MMKRLWCCALREWAEVVSSVNGDEKRDVAARRYVCVWFSTGKYQYVTCHL